MMFVFDLALLQSTLLREERTVEPLLVTGQQAFNPHSCGGATKSL